MLRVHSALYEKFKKLLNFYVLGKNRSSDMFLSGTRSKPYLLSNRWRHDLVFKELPSLTLKQKIGHLDRGHKRYNHILFILDLFINSDIHVI